MEGTERHPAPVTRREFLHWSAAGTACLGVPAAFGPGAVDWLRRAGTAEPLDVARAAARWIASHRIETGSGLDWPRVPGEDRGGDLSLYHGSPGVVLFLLELHGSTGEARALEDALDGAAHLRALVESGAEIPPGLYTGLGGLAFTLDLAARVAGDPGLAAAARLCVERIVSSARPTGAGVAWFDGDPSDAVSDIVSGAAGIGLTLLRAHETRGQAGALDTAVAAARHLASLGETAPGGRKWAMSPSFPRLMPNFSHGTAGVAYFLARVAEHTGDERLLKAAMEGAGYLMEVSDCDERGCAVFHHEPEGEDLYYLSWCHGPAGTARLFHQLALVTGESSWREWIHRGAAGIRGRGIPERRTPGYWNNISQCCGDAGVGEFFLALHALTGESGHLAFARAIADYVVGRSDDPEAPALRWTQAEHRVRPELLQAQTGWMQGAAGVGAFFLHLAARETGRRPLVVLPDSPWRSVL